MEGVIAVRPGARRSRLERTVAELLAAAGIELGGRRPEDVRVLDGRFYEVGLARGLAGIRDAYVEGWWETDRLDEVAYRFLRHGPRVSYAARATLLYAALRGRLLNLQSSRRAVQVRAHYDLGDDLFAAMLDRRRVYSCAYWKDAATLDEAQEAKLDLVCRKVGLAPGMRVLDIGCGWGSFARFAAERYGVSVLGVTVSRDQARLAVEACAGLPVEIRLQDYRALSEGDGPFDAVVSLGMFEHVGHKNYGTYFRLVRRLLRPEGTFLLQTIGGNRSRASFDPWMDAHIFPGAMLPSAKQICAAAEGVLQVEDWHGFGPDYDRTLLAWHENFERAWPSLRARYGERFRRMWKCYLLTCAGSFRARENQLWQVAFSPPGRNGCYASVR